MPKEPRNFLKWTTIGCLGILSLLAFIFIFLIWRLTPLVSVNEQNGNVSLLGGMISVSGDSVFNENFDESVEPHTEWLDEDFKKIEGDYIPLGEEKELKIFFSSVKTDIYWKDQKKIAWTCKIRSNVKPSLIETKGSSLVLYLKTADECEINIPKNIKLLLRAQNGKVHLETPTETYKVELENGLVTIKPAKSVDFYYDLKVKRGYIADFDNKKKKENTKLAEVFLVSGSIQKI